MRIIVTGKGGKAGSWAIRGQQLGAAIGAVVVPLADAAQLKRADVAVVVKRIPDSLLANLRSSGRPWVLDLVDGWPQPAGNAWPKSVAVQWLRERLGALQPTAVVFPTTQMQIDSCWQGPSIVLPHHAWPKYERQPVRASVSLVGYEGDAGYLGRWAPLIERECTRRGWRFVVNGDLASCDIGLALRDVSGYPAGAWKANTKLANLQALGIPAICSPEASYREFGSGSEAFVTEHSELSEAMENLTDRPIRAAASEAMSMATPRLEQVAGVYRAWLQTIAST